MLKSYFKIALRYLAKNKIYSLINIAGLSLSLACAMIIVLYVKDELSFDRFHKDISKIYLIGTDFRFADGSSMDKFGVTSGFHGPRFKANLPEIESFVRIRATFLDIKQGDVVQPHRIMQADSNFFSFFTFPLLQGDRKTALFQPHGVVISEDFAKSYFGQTDVINKTILININDGDFLAPANQGTFSPYVVTAVSKRCPENSSIQFEVLMPYVPTPQEEANVENWLSPGFSTFLKIQQGTDISATTVKMQNVFERESKAAMEKVRSAGFDQSFFHVLLPLVDAHLSQEFKAELGLDRGSNPLYAYVLSGIVAFILIIACMNFINLTIARSIRRSKEIGIRKVIGSGRAQLIMQFMGESLLLCMLSFAGAILISQLFLPYFNDIVNKQLSLSYLADITLISGYLVLLVFTSLLAGFYPAIVLSGFNPVQALYNQFQLRSKTSIQKILIVFQFSLATVMIIATFVIFQQFNFLTTKDLGYNSDHIIQVDKRNMTDREARIFKEELLKNPNIVSVAPKGPSEMNAKINGDTIQHFKYDIVDENFIDFLGLPVVQGRNFSTQFPSDSSEGIIVNEAFVKMAHWRDPIGQKINMFLYDGHDRTVIGVIKDYHFASLSEKIKPQALAPIGYANILFKYMLVRIKPNSESASLAHIEKVYKKLFPLIPYSYEFTDEINRQLYKTEAKAKTVILFGALMTIFIACMGLFGLSILMTEKKFKEIGIRKVLGASVRVITLTLSREFVILVVVAIIIAVPLAYYGANRWLETYPYRVEINSAIFISTALLVLMVTLLTTGYHSVKAASMNPVDALRRE